MVNVLRTIVRNGEVIKMKDLKVGDVFEMSEPDGSVTMHCLAESEPSIKNDVWGLEATILKTEKCDQE